MNGGDHRFHLGDMSGLGVVLASPEESHRRCFPSAETLERHHPGDACSLRFGEKLRLELQERLNGVMGRADVFKGEASEICF
jgi:hypothetical protein